jgi:hypothetical protein
MFYKGERKVLASKKIDLPSIGKWYRIWIHMDLSKIKLYIKLEDKPDSPIQPVSEDEPIALEAEDSKLAKGGVGYFTNCAINARFDMF